MEYSDIPYKVLKYTAGQINYGGRVTDDWDRRCIMNILEDFYYPDVISENHCYDASKVYHQLPVGMEHSVNTVDYFFLLDLYVFNKVFIIVELYGLYQNTSHQRYTGNIWIAR
jgi:hypothetical protein